MAGRAEIFVGFVNDGVTVGSGATAVSDQFVVNGEGMVLLNQAAQTGAVIANVTSVTKLAGPYVPIVSMPANMMAGTITFLKIGIDIREGRGIQTGDVLSVVGNVAGVIATMAVLGGASPALIVGMGATTIISGLYSIIGSETYKAITSNAADFFKGNPSVYYFDYVCAPDMKIVHKDALRAEYNNQMLSCSWISETGELMLSATTAPNEDGPGVGFIPSANPVLPTPPPDIVPVITIGPLEFGDGNSNGDDNGDEYGCCTSGSDGYV